MTEQESTSPPVRTCVKCGCQSPLLDAFHVEEQAGGPVYYCPKCREQRGWLDEARNRHLGGIEICVAIGLTLAAGAVLIIFTIVPSQLFVILASYYLLLPISITLHEAGHAGTALLLGLRVYSISIGLGRPLVRLSIGQTELAISNPWSGGFTHLGHPPGQFCRWKHFLVVLAGPAVTASLVAVVWFGMDSHRLVLVGDRTAFQLVLVGFSLTNLVGLIANLWPRQVVTAIGKTWSDGLALWRILRMNQDDFRDAEIVFMMGEVRRCMDRKDYAAAKTWCRRGLELQAGNRALTSLLALSFEQNKEYAEARRIFLQLIEDPIVDHLRAVGLQVVAMTDLKMYEEKEEQEILAEADRSSREALELEPWCVEARRIRGCVLILMGDQEGGLALLEGVLPDESNNGKKAHCLAHMALAETIKGHQQEAEKHLEVVSKLGLTSEDCAWIRDWINKRSSQMSSPKV